MPEPLPEAKPLYWIGSAKRDLMSFPEAVRHEIGVALGVAQFGGKSPSAKPWNGLGSGIFEVVEDFSGDAYRAVYVVRFARAIYVLHCFQKKSHRGIRTPKLDVALVRRRLELAANDYHGK